MRWGLVLIGAVVGIGLAWAGPAGAMQFRPLDLGGGNAAVSAIGEIGIADLPELEATVEETEKGGQKVVALTLDSRGGLLIASVAMAEYVHAHKLGVVVRRGATCASGCFFLFAAASFRIAGPNARIGVHNAATEDGKPSEWISSLSAAYIVQYGVPQSVADRLVATPPQEVAWLDRADLALMGVVPAEDWIAVKKAVAAALAAGDAASIAVRQATDQPALPAMPAAPPSPTPN